MDVSGWYKKPGVIWVNTEEESDYIYLEWCIECEIQHKPLPEPLVFVKGIPISQQYEIPGHNHSYQPGKRFYTLQNVDGAYLSNPYAIMEGKWTRKGQMVDESVGIFQPFGKTVNDATALKWTSAWVVYNVPDLRELYRLLNGPRQLYAGKVPGIPCTGLFEQTGHGITAKNIVQLQPNDVKILEAMEAKELGNKLMEAGTDGFSSHIPYSSPQQANDVQKSQPAAFLHASQEKQEKQKKQKTQKKQIEDWSQFSRSSRQQRNKLPAIEPGVQEDKKQVLQWLSQGLSSPKAGGSGLRRRRRDLLPPLPPSDA